MSPDPRMSEIRLCACGADLPARRRKWCSEDCRKRAWDRANRLTCVDCGGQLAVGVHKDINNPAERCASCDQQRRHDELAARAEMVARLYNEGKSYKEIALALGWSGHPSRLVREARRRGLIGYRNRVYGRVA